MGSYVSSGKNNDELIDHLVEAEFIKTPMIQQVFRAVDRGNYCIPNDRHNAYKDIAWKVGNLHISAPCVYSLVMEALKLSPGLTFLNLGSGTGYLSTMVGLLLGPYGTNHGVELCSEVIDFAYERLNDFVNNSQAIDEFDFCEPTFALGNCLWMDNSCQLYDRVYCGASCPPEYEPHMKNLIKVGGILVMPLNEKLLKITRIDETTWHTVKILSVSFAPLICPTTPVEPYNHIYLGNINPPKLQHICRSIIRKILRKNIDTEQPNIQAKILQKERWPMRQVSQIIIPFVDESEDSSDLDYDSDNPEFRISTRLPSRMSAVFEEFVRLHTELPLFQDLDNTGASDSESEMQSSNLRESNPSELNANRVDTKVTDTKVPSSDDDEIFSLFTVKNVRQPVPIPLSENKVLDYDLPPSASTRSKKKRKHSGSSQNTLGSKNSDPSTSTEHKFKYRRTSATVYWKKHKQEKKEVKPANIENDEDNYTSAMIKKIGALPLPLPLIRYLNYKRKNL